MDSNLTFSEAKREFDIRYYLWAASEFEKEIEASFPKLRLFKVGSAWKTYQFMLKLPKSEQLVLAHALLKRFHSNAVKALGETCSPEEEALRSRRDAAFSNIVSFGEEIRARKKAGEPVKLASKARLRKVVNAQSIALFGRECIDLSSAEEEQLILKIERAGWIVRTIFYFDQKGKTVLSYFHNIESLKTFPYRGTEIMMGLRGMISLNSYLGVSSQTRWHYITSEEAESSCSAALKLCAHFFGALPGLLKGLECETVVPDKDYENSGKPLR